jgi:hypothetical protein
MPADRPPEPWDSFLSELDALLGRPTEFHCFGGFVATMLYGVPRTTEDVDILPVMEDTARGEAGPESIAGKGSSLHGKYKLYVDIVTVTPHPDNYAERLTEMFPGAYRNLRIMALDPYDLALMKLERNDRKDRDDVMYMAVSLPLDVGVLRRRYAGEFRPYLLNEERADKTLELWIEMIEEMRG